MKKPRTEKHALLLRAGLEVRRWSLLAGEGTDLDRLPIPIARTADVQAERDELVLVEAELIVQGLHLAHEVPYADCLEMETVDHHSDLAGALVGHLKRPLLEEVVSVCEGATIRTVDGDMIRQNGIPAGAPYAPASLRMVAGEPAVLMTRCATFLKVYYSLSILTNVLLRGKDDVRTYERLKDVIHKVYQFFKDTPDAPDIPDIESLSRESKAAG